MTKGMGSRALVPTRCQAEGTMLFGCVRPVTGCCKAGGLPGLLGEAESL